MDLSKGHTGVEPDPELGPSAPAAHGVLRLVMEWGDGAMRTLTLGCAAPVCTQEATITARPICRCRRCERPAQTVGKVFTWGFAPLAGLQEPREGVVPGGWDSVALSGQFRLGGWRDGQGMLDLNHVDLVYSNNRKALSQSYTPNFLADFWLAPLTLPSASVSCPCIMLVRQKAGVPESGKERETSAPSQTNS